MGHSTQYDRLRRAASRWLPGCPDGCQAVHRRHPDVPYRKPTTAPMRCVLIRKGIVLTDRTSPLTAVLVHGAWADGSSWSRVPVVFLSRPGVAVTAAPIPLTSLADDVAALDRALDRVGGPTVLVGHAYAGAVIGASTHRDVHALVYVAALAPDEGETVADVFYRTPPHPAAPQLAPDGDGYIWLPTEAFAAAFTKRGLRTIRSRWLQFNDHPGRLHPGAGPSCPLEEAANVVFACRRGPDDRPCYPDLHGGPDGCPAAGIWCRPHPDDHAAIRRR